MIEGTEHTTQIQLCMIVTDRWLDRKTDRAKNRQYEREIIEQINDQTRIRMDRGHKKMEKLTDLYASKQKRWEEKERA